MNGDDGFGFGGDFAAGVVDVDIEADGAGIDENGDSTKAADAACGGEEGEGGDEDFISGFDAERHESEQDSVGAGGDTDGVFGLGELGDGSFELCDFWPHDELAGAEDAQEGFRELFFERVILGVDVEEGDWHGA